MSDEVMYSRASSEDDDAFNEWLSSEEKKAADKKAAKEAAENYSNDYDDIKYVGLSKEHPTIVRFVGNFVEEDPLAHRKNPTDMKFMHISKIKGDDGKPFYLYLPLRGDDPETDHLIWRIVDKVLEKEWIKDPKTGKKKGVEIHAEDQPEIYEMIKKGGYTPADGEWPYKCARGWKAPEMLLINCIDRRDDWCKTNKHTKLLSKSVKEGVTKDGKPTEYAEKGVPAYGFFGPLTQLRKNFKVGWEHFDVVITRTGDGTDTVNNLFNGTVSATPEAVKAGFDKSMGIDASEYKYISFENDLTDEELSYQRYDLDKNFQPTSYFTIKKHLFKSIQKIDLAFDTDYAKQLESLVAEESAKWKAEHPKKDEKAAESTVAESAKVEVEAADIPVDNPADAPSFDKMETVQESAPAQEAAPVRRVAAAETGLSAEKIAVLKGYAELTDEEKSYIKDVVLKADGSLDHVEWTENAPALLDCPSSDGGCGQLSPNSFKVCPCCGKHFA